MLPWHLNPYIKTSVSGQAINRITGKTGQLSGPGAGRANGMGMSFAENTPAASTTPSPRSLSLPPAGGPPTGPIDSPGEVADPGKVSNVGDGGSLGGLNRASDGGGYGVGGTQNMTLRGGLGRRTPPSLASLLEGLRY